MRLPILRLGLLVALSVLSTTNAAPLSARGDENKGVAFGFKGTYSGTYVGFLETEMKRINDMLQGSIQHSVIDAKSLVSRKPAQYNSLRNILVDAQKGKEPKIHTLSNSIDQKSVREAATLVGQLDKSFESLVDTLEKQLEILNKLEALEKGVPKEFS